MSEVSTRTTDPGKALAALAAYVRRHFAPAEQLHVYYQPEGGNVLVTEVYDAAGRVLNDPGDDESDLWYEVSGEIALLWHTHRVRVDHDECDAIVLPSRTAGAGRAAAEALGRGDIAGAVRILAHRPAEEAGEDAELAGRIAAALDLFRRCADETPGIPDSHLLRAELAATAAADTVVILKAASLLFTGWSLNYLPEPLYDQLTAYVAGLDFGEGLDYLLGCISRGYPTNAFPAW